ncbi:ATPase WRNIP1 [Pyrus ussuriensis x Pyrus communis]|uniref:ATPase WRNIP1 n=1 Tax=Pyrus ussuriensis x Pyrus communis TaxID=2448454 RepID=A0A5N5G035_9ROSA|nr:ATPase WRNIP1 [Pyrus ussuriensis x Pyrus communis]
MMEAKLPGCGLKAFPHIESRIKMLKAKYFALTELLALSGFEWNEEKMMLGKKDASGLYYKPFPHYHNLGEIYAKDCAVGANAGNVDDDEEEVRLEDANVNQNEGEDESGYDFDTSFLVPNTQQQRNAEITNFLAKEHDLLRVFFNMSDERKSAYVTTLLQTWVHNDV